MRKLIEKGKFEQIDNDFMSEGILVLRELTKTQKRYNKPDTDTFINELRDQMVGHFLGFKLVNTSKHGFDCKYSNNQNIYLEVKSASYDINTWNATFNDTTIEKAKLFQSDIVFLALAIWENASDLKFICFGKNKLIGEFLENKVKWFKEGNTVRSTQSISFKKLVLDYGFKICPINREIITIRKEIENKNTWFSKVTDDVFVNEEEIKRIIL